MQTELETMLDNMNETEALELERLRHAEKMRQIAAVAYEKF